MVALNIPSLKFKEFADEYIKLFDKNGERPDKNRTDEYRHMVGLPGGMNSPLIHQLKEAVSKLGLTLHEAIGDDSDNLTKRTILVYDTKRFPFYRGEIFQ